jgi:tRNA A37 threonylcarbamoyladenosine synthetase subunit TsaC/SUA5/YrdC
LSKVYLVQTDTTVGFTSKDYKKLNRIKNRAEETKTILTVASFRDLKKEIRVFKNHKKLIRRSKKTTFIYSENAYRVINKDSVYRDLLKKEGGLYSTSANETREVFNQEWAEKQADVIVIEQDGFFEGVASKIYKLGKKKIKAIR